MGCAMKKKEKQTISDEALLRDARYDLLAVTVKSVDARDATNGRPPTVVLGVLERFRGENRRKSITVAWPAVPNNDLAPTDPKRVAWLAKPYVGPAVNDTFIVLMEKASGAASSVLTRCRFPYSPAERLRVLTLARITSALDGSS